MATDQLQLYTFEDDCYAIVMDLKINSEDLMIKIISDFDFELTKLPRLVAGCADFPRYFDSIIDQITNINTKITSHNKIPDNCCVNYYRNGEDYMGWQINTNNNPMYNILLGEPRYIEIRKTLVTESPITRIPFKAGSLFIMYGGKFQTLYQYRLPKIEADQSSIHLMFQNSEY